MLYMARTRRKGGGDGMVNRFSRFFGRTQSKPAHVGEAASLRQIVQRLGQKQTGIVRMVQALGQKQASIDKMVQMLSQKQPVIDDKLAQFQTTLTNLDDVVSSIDAVEKNTFTKEIAQLKSQIDGLKTVVRRQVDQMYVGPKSSPVPILKI